MTAERREKRRLCGGGRRLGLAIPSALEKQQKFSPKSRPFSLFAIPGVAFRSLANSFCDCGTPSADSSAEHALQHTTVDGKAWDARISTDLSLTISPVRFYNHTRFERRPCVNTVYSYFRQKPVFWVLLSSRLGLERVVGGLEPFWTKKNAAETIYRTSALKEGDIRG